jgi:tRNA threonylcarbamoyladenosine biosynthesis protein TsaB
MLLIAVDTSGKHGSIALCRGDEESFDVLQLMSLEGGTYSAQLMPRIAEVLKQKNLDKIRVDAFAVVSGSGSFTGLRVGLATIKAFCEVLHKPLVTASMLEAIVLTYGICGQTSMVALDAGRGEVYVGEYELLPDRARAVREYITKLDGFVTEAAAISADVLTPDTKIAEAVQAIKPRTRLVPAIHADEIGRIGVRKLLAGETVDPATVDVNYIRRSDAELFSTPKH